jgi:uncharacterized integral membrane protein
MSRSGPIEPAAGSARGKPSARTITAIVLVVLIVLFAVANSQSVTIHWIVTTTQTPMIVVIAGCGLIGFAAGWLVARRRASRANAR